MTALKLTLSFFSKVDKGVWWWTRVHQHAFWNRSSLDLSYRLPLRRFIDIRKMKCVSTRRCGIVVVDYAFEDVTDLVALFAIHSGSA